MKTTIEIPDPLMRDVKLRAVHEGRKLKEVVADLLRKGLDSAEGDAGAQKPSVTFDAELTLPVIQCRHPAAPTSRLTPDRVATILLEQEAVWNAETD
jgi:hypothetical protein